jgi:hypothetical protein
MLIYAFGVLHPLCSDQIEFLMIPSKHVIFIKCNEKDQVKEDKMGRSCSIHSRGGEVEEEEEE